MRTAQEIGKELGEVNAKIENLLAKDTAGDNDDAELTTLDTRAAELKSELDSANKRESIAARTAANKAALSAPRDLPTSPVEHARTSGLRERVVDDPVGGFARYDDFIGAVRSASTPGGVVHANLLSLNASYGNNSEGGSEGGFLIPPEYSNRILERASGDLGILGQCDRMTLTGNSVTINGMADHDRKGTAFRHSGVVAYWVGEGEQISRSKLQFRQVTLRPYKLAALSYVTEEEMQDTANFGVRLMDKQAGAIGDEITEALMFGNGVAKPLGALSGSNPCVTVDKESAQPADTIVAENIINMWSVIDDGSRGRGQWYFNGEGWPQLLQLYVKAGTDGYPLMIPAGGFSGAPYNTIFGRPSISTDHCEALGDSGDIAFADWSQYLVALKGTTSTEMSIHLRFDYAETAFRSLFRIDGRPAWDQSLKPRKGNDARRVSPFVKLAARA